MPPPARRGAKSTARKKTSASASGAKRSTARSRSAPPAKAASRRSTTRKAASAAASSRSTPGRKRTAAPKRSAAKTSSPRRKPSPVRKTAARRPARTATITPTPPLPDGAKPAARERAPASFRLGLFAVRRRWWILAVWLAAMVGAFPLLGKLGDRLSQGGFEVPGSQSDQVARAIERDFTGQFDLTDLVVLSSDTLTASDREFQVVVGRVRNALEVSPGVAAVSNPYAAPERFISPDGRTVTATVGLTDDQDQALKHNDDLEEAVTRATEGTEVRALLTGAPPFYAAFTETTTEDLERAETVALPISLLILVLAFGSLVAAGMPLALALLALGLSFGIISVIAATTTVSIFTQNVASMLGIGVGIDYSLFIVSRYRQELRVGQDVSLAVGRAMATSGKAVMVSGLAVVVALSGTLLVNIQAFRSMGWGAMIAVTMALLAAITLLPALLGMVGFRINRLRVGSRLTAAGRGGTFWHQWAGRVMRRPWRAIAVSVAILALLAFPVKDLRLGSSGPSILPEDATPRVAAEVVAAAFGEGQVAPVQILVTHPLGVLEGGFADVHGLARRIARDPEVVRVDSIATIRNTFVSAAAAIARSPEARPFVASIVSADGRSTLLSAVTEHGAQSDETGEFVNRIRGALRALVPEGATAIVGGDAGLNVDINEEVGGKLLPVVGLVLALSFLVLMLFFRSLLLPLKAILMNAGAVLATYGVLVFIFQSGHLEGLLGFEAAGHIESFLPLFLFTILFGLSMDYEVFMLARVREEYLRTHDNTEAVGWGLERTARIITSAAAIMVTVFGAFAFASLIPIKAMGFGLATAVFLDATLIRIVLVPATMRLMGKWNWWLPGWLDRVLPDVSLEGTEQIAAPAEPAKALATA